MQAASVVVTPTVLANAELDGLEGLLEEAADYPLLIVPNKVARVPDRRLVERLRADVDRFDLPVAPLSASDRTTASHLGRRPRAIRQTSPDSWTGPSSLPIGPCCR